jgi:hypothetical protein
MALTRAMLNETPRRSYRLIWEEEIKPRLTSAGKTVPFPGMTIDPPENPPQDASESKTAEPENGESPPDNLPRVKPSRFGRSPPLARFDTDGLMTAHFRQTTSRKTLAEARCLKNGGAAIWRLVDISIKEGFFGEPTNTDIRDVGLRLVLPWLSRSALVKTFDLSKPVYRDLVENVMFPLLHEHPELRGDQERFERAFDQRRRTIEEGQRRATRMAEHQQKIASLPENQVSVIAYGTPLWPPEGDLTGLFTYEELSHACWFADFFMEISRKDWRSHETAMAARQLAKWTEPMRKGFAEAVRAIFNAYESHPEGEKRFPSPPVNFRSERSTDAQPT